MGLLEGLLRGDTRSLDNGSYTILSTPYKPRGSGSRLEGFSINCSEPGASQRFALKGLGFACRTCAKPTRAWLNGPLRTPWALKLQTLNPKAKFLNPKTPQAVAITASYCRDS